MPSSRSQTRPFAQTALPWVIGAGALALYLVTLNRSINLAGLPSLAQAAGWNWRPVFLAPLTFLATYPVRWMPAPMQLAGLNLISVVCACLTLVLLARSVALLPQDRTRPQRENEPGSRGLLSVSLSWLPPLAAAVVCGLQLSFWEHAVTGTGEALNLLVFAYVVRCLLEHRADRRPAWLYQMAFVYGLGVTNNAAMIAYFPVLLAALVWIQGLAFFRLRTLAVMSLLGLAGLSLYLVLPALAGGEGGADFLTALRVNLGAQKRYVLGFPRHLLLLMGLSSLLPLLLVSIRWPDSHGDTSAMGSWATETMIHVMNGAFLLLCVWVAFDPAFSPRAQGRGIPFLTFYYLGALCVGYFCGYFLLVFGERREKSSRGGTPLQDALAGAIVGTVCLGTVAVAVLLLWQNIPNITRLNSPELARYARQLARSLPSGKPVAVLSDDLTRLQALQAVLSPQAAASTLLLDTASLGTLNYQRHLARRHPKQWTAGQLLPNAPGLFPSQLVEQLMALTQSHDLYYLHPSYGYYFEQFELRPQGLVCRLVACPTNSTASPPLTSEEIAFNDAAWKTLDSESLAALERKIQELARGGKPELLFYKQEPLNYTLVWTASAYSRALNYWAVRLQRQGLYDKAQPFLRKALAVNPSNPSAFVNLEFNQSFQKTGRALPRFSDEAMDKLRPYSGNVDFLYGVNGPIDEPSFRTEVMGASLLRSELYRQAEQEYRRALEISPKEFSIQTALGGLLIQSGQPGPALELARAIRENSAESLRNPTNLTSILQLEAWAHFLNQDFPRAERILLDSQQSYPELDTPFTALAQIHTARARAWRQTGHTNEARQAIEAILSLYQRQILVQPKNTTPLINGGGLCIELGLNDQGLQWLTRALEIDPQSIPARINRALACLRLAKLDAARTDYLELLRLNPALARAHFGLAEIAYQKREWPEALRRYEDYLRYTPPDSAEFKYAQGRVDEISKKIKPSRA